MGPEAVQAPHRVSLHAVCSPETGLIVSAQWAGSVPALLCRFPGGLKERTARDQFRLQPEEILRRAVYGMLPKNKLRKVGLVSGIPVPKLRFSLAGS